jgi:membrane protein
MLVQKYFRLVRQAAADWSNNGAPTLGAALAFYAVFSLSPLLLIVISVAALVLGEKQARHEVAGQVRQTLGPLTADAVDGLLEATHQTGGTGGNLGMSLVGLTALLVGASGAFGQLQDALNLIWKAEAPPRTGNFLVHFLHRRLLSFAAVLGSGLLLLGSLTVSTALAAVGDWLPAPLAGAMSWWQGLFALVSFSFITLLFALLFKVLPDAPIAWRDVWLGAVLTAALFTLGQYLIGLYLGRSSVASAYGAAGSLAVIMVWVYYSAQIVLFGAELTHVYAKEHGSHAPGAMAGAVAS